MCAFIIKDHVVTAWAITGVDWRQSRASLTGAVALSKFGFCDAPRHFYDEMYLVFSRQRDYFARASGFVSWQFCHYFFIYLFSAEYDEVNTEDAASDSDGFEIISNS